MFKKYTVFILIMAVMVQASMAQAKADKQKIILGSISNIGLINGSNGPSVSLQTILGASFMGSFAGVGAGLDYYRFRSIPLFFDLRHEFGKGHRNIFVYGDIGYNYDWLSDKNKENNYLFSISNYKGGIYYDAGLGYKISFNRKDALLLSVGYSEKKIENEAGATFCPFAGPCSPDMEKYSYTMRTLIIKAGWRF